jgi:hypothetical protein
MISFGESVVADMYIAHGAEARGDARTDRRGCINGTLPRPSDCDQPLILSGLSEQGRAKPGKRAKKVGPRPICQRTALASALAKYRRTSLSADATLRRLTPFRSACTNDTASG